MAHPGFDPSGAQSLGEMAGGGTRWVTEGEAPTARVPVTTGEGDGAMGSPESQAGCLTAGPPWCPPAGEELTGQPCSG